MKALKIALVLPWLLVVSGVLMAQSQYGEATIERGSMKIIRSGQTLSFDEANQTIPVVEQDLVRVGPDSRVALKSRENATMELGSNSVFHVKPWRARGKTGFMRALFGRFRASIVGLVGGEQFNVKTATATIGVKGTDYLTQVLKGGTVLGVTESVVEMTGQTGDSRDVVENTLSVVYGVSPATFPTEILDDMLAALQELNSEQANDPAANVTQIGRILLREGIITQDQLNELEGQYEDPAVSAAVEELPPLPDPNEASEAVNRANVQIGF